MAVIGLPLVLTQCREVPADAISPDLTRTLSRGQHYVDPVVQTSPVAVSLIATVKNQYDNNMAEFKGTTRPTSVSAYVKSVIEPIAQVSLPAHVFQWQTTGQPVMMVALFKAVVQVNGKTNEISNKADLVWLWTPPPGNADPGMVTFDKGSMATLVDNQYVLSPATGLAPGYYIWCVLAWDRQGVNIVAATRELPIIVLAR